VPIYKCPNGKYRIGNGPCIYTTLAAVKRAYAAYMAKRDAKQKGKAQK